MNNTNQSAANNDHFTDTVIFLAETGKIAQYVDQSKHLYGAKVFRNEAGSAANRDAVLDDFLLSCMA